MPIFERFERIDRWLTEHMAQAGIPALRVSLGIIFFWFGFLKFFPGVSSAETLAIETTRILSLGLVSDQFAIFGVALLETIIGLGLIFGVALRATLFLLALQMVGTLTPLLLFPAQTFTSFPFVPTLEGQYIIKNLILISAAIVVGATVRGGGLISTPLKKA